MARIARAESGLVMITSTEALTAGRKSLRITGRCEQQGSRDRRHETAAADGHQKPEPESAEQRDKDPDEDDQGVPGMLVAVLVEVQGEFSSGQDAQEQARPDQRGVLAAIEGLSGEIAGQTIQDHGNQSQDHLPRQRRAPPESLSLDGLMSYFGSHSVCCGQVRSTRAAGGDVGGLAGAQTLILHRLVRCVDVTDQDRHVDRRQDHDRLPSVTECHSPGTLSLA